MNSIIFEVQESQLNTCQIMFTQNGKITCSCLIGKKKQLCKHVIRLIEYNITDLISNNSELLIIAHEWINSNQNYLNAYKEYCDLIWKEREIKTKLNNAKNSLMNIITP